MTGKAYYLTTLGDWERHAARFAHSHYVVLDALGVSSVGALHEGPPGRPLVEPGGSVAPASGAPATPSADASPNHAARILVLIEGDEGMHLSLEDDPAFEALPHPLAQKPISPAAQSALAPHGVAPGASTFDAAEALARLHPLLKHHVF